MRSVVGLAVFLAACASSAPPPLPKVERLPEAALDVICSRLRAEGMTSELRVVKETQPIVTPGALQALAEISDRAKPPKPEALQAIASAAAVPIEPRSNTCISRYVTAADAARVNDVMILQFSSPFVNPFGRGESGTLVRISLGGESSTWYWIPLAYRSERWMAGAPMPLAFVE
jgi:hypothetical protein